ncbi:hypothetical protein [Streptomyces roseolilacinus]|uniref:Secreted protein n=1 Tax=Streptomyces roseolilacinus TaxID=66904 RepID=A0A918B354_9ACTN|nr:hypothetical protein [Streptomyces roseolilacinus]GGQ21411.1 hypothetical protein GCM10010249_45170 [Streptomyces roseolilacinus]
MKFRNTLACAFAALAATGGAAGTAQAADDDTTKFGNDGQIVSCGFIEIVDQPNLGPSDNNTDCSENVREKKTGLVHVVDEVLLPRHHEYR